MNCHVPDAALRSGFLQKPVSVHTSKTMMLKELSLLLASGGAAAALIGPHKGCRPERHTAPAAGRWNPLCRR
ncbi:MAG TPA: hypothetical protein VGS41_01245 [Chthonomonadales bacterium]|nr:hypothetical protein [Chthonomonadales bacterium]